LNIATALFCDDIRFEVGNKLTYVGCYDVEIVLPELPFVLPRFCVSVELHLREFPLDETPIELRIFLPGDQPAAASISSSGVLPKVMPPQPDPEDPFDAKPILRVRQNILMSQVEIKEAGSIRVRIMWGKEELRAGSLQVRRLPSADGLETASS